ncbi:SpoIID/LytB domain-containing protein [Acidaminobacter sp. JC074]|uniref:SpoIID/LytB domain-containing protein n=1 Tax=Acidaminobacter sp. JC074 TaxID=2530199 RepID=UPI001F0F769C|nr:SpoIID/LytB domain-containing protein [Acidaminobacter sp. JC074]MCH4888313.1 SpoIID/LytB domain-containing protein [Acidaminobacter sp. JC074]
MRKISLILVLSLILSLVFSIMGFAEVKDETIIKIGLQYTSLDSNDQKAPVTIKGQVPFEIGQLVDGAYQSLCQTDISQFAFVKDDGYHAVMGPYASYELAKADTKKLNGGFVVLKDLFYVYGISTNQSTANSQAQSVGGTVALPNPNLVVLKDSQILFGLDTTNDYVVAPMNAELKDAFSYFGDMPYRGGFGAKRLSTNDVSVINYVYMDEYLYGVVPREMDKSWPIEALKAQAIVARNFAVANFNKFSHYGFNLDNTTLSQVYGGYKYEGPVSNQAVDETSGLVLKYEDTLVNAFYHSNSGGYTENSENVFSSPQDYTKGIYDPFSLGAPNDSWTLEYSKSFIENTLKSKGYNLGSLKNFFISEYTDNNRVYEATFVGSNETVLLPKQDIRKVFGYNEMKSTLIKVVPDNAIVVTDGQSFQEKSPSNLTVISGDGKTYTLDSNINVFSGKSTSQVTSQATSYTIHGKGWGHGLGMSQWGAKNMAEQGLNFEDILTFYYTGTHIE